MSVAESSQLEALKFGTEQFIHDDDFVTRLDSGRPLRVKLGIDPTAADIHLGFAVVLNKLRQFQDQGHTAVLILGDFTALVGDPSGRSKTRPRLSVDQVNENAETYVEQITDILDPARLEVRRNSEWLGLMGMEGVLDLTSRYTVARMLERDDFANRYRAGTPISVSEFLYPLMQGWDSVMVEADVELGGTDQLFNLLVGRDLQRQMGQPAQAIVTMPLLEGLDGVNKMSKSLGNYVGVREPASEQFGKIMSIPDELIGRYARDAAGWPEGVLLPFLEGLDDGSLHPNAAKRAVARSVVDRYHGAGQGAGAEAGFDRVFKEGSVPEDIPTRKVSAARTAPEPVADLLVEFGLAPSKREARRLIEQGGVSVNGEKVQLDAPDLVPAEENRTFRVGKRRWMRLEVE
ncbi:MAG: tyrosine--tRNA ligase [Acidimicrobiia bacterium]|nr:tyrosine--tRNA ligase [Acidimicrobiia bacterium]MBP8179843.1 tyrosine--tRNA ligase [Acidimicrobiia bacterium]